MGRRARWGILTAALFVAASSSARADDDRANREAEARFKEGLSRVKTKDYEAARLSFEQAYAVLHRPLILWNLALAEEKTSHPLEALGHFRQVAREAPTDADRANAQKHVDSLLGQLARIDVQAPAGTALALDGGDLAGTTPLGEPIDVMPGHHVVAAKLAAGSAKSTDVDAMRLGQVALHVSFAADAPPPAAVIVLTPAAPPADAVPTATAVPGLPALPRRTSPPKPFWTVRTVTATVFAGAAIAVVGVRRGLRNRVAEQQEHRQHPVHQTHDGSSFCHVTPPRRRTARRGTTRSTRAEPGREPLERLSTSPPAPLAARRRGQLVLLAEGRSREGGVGAAERGTGQGRARGRRAILTGDSRGTSGGRSGAMRGWILWVGLMAAALLVAAALVYGCGETSFGTCADNGTCIPDGGLDAAAGADDATTRRRAAPAGQAGPGEDVNVPQKKDGGDRRRRGGPRCACKTDLEPKDEPMPGRTRPTECSCRRWERPTARGRRCRPSTRSTRASRWR